MSTPTPESLSPARLAEIRSLLRYESSISFHSARAKESMLLLLAEVERLNAENAEQARVLASAGPEIKRLTERIVEVEAHVTEHVRVYEAVWGRLQDEQRASSRLSAAAQDALTSLNELIEDCDDPGVAALGARHELDMALVAFRAVAQQVTTAPQGGAS